MSDLQVKLRSTSQCSSLGLTAKEWNWYAVHTGAQHEKRFATQLEEKCFCTFLPHLNQAQRWSDRRNVVKILMFCC